MKIVTSLAAASLAFLSAAPALAQTSGYYTATPKSQVARDKFITRSTLWKCDGGVCAANKSAERDAVLCEVVARKVGGLSAFTVGGTAYSEESLAKCNARVK